MDLLQIGDIWYGKDGTPYEGVTAKIDAITARNVQVSFDRIVNMDGAKLGGTVMTQKQFRANFDPGQQLSLW
jgi:hypothetical protein